MDADPQAVELSADRIDEERHVVGHDADHGAPAGPPVHGDSRVDDPDNGLLRGTPAGSVDDVRDRTHHSLGAPTREVAGIDIPVEVPGEPFVSS